MRSICVSTCVSLLLVATRVVSVFETVGLNSPLRSRAGGFPPSPAPPRAQAAALQRPHFMKLKSYKYTSSQHTKFNIHRAAVVQHARVAWDMCVSSAHRRTLSESLLSGECERSDLRLG